MEVKTVLDLFKEKQFYSLNNKDPVEDNDNTRLRRLDDICVQIQRGSPYLLNNRGRQLLGLMENVNFEIMSIWLHKENAWLPPLEILCFLHRTGVMQITTFLYFKPEFCTEISSQLVEMVTKTFPRSEDQEAVENIVKIVLSSLMNVGNHSLRKLFSLTSSIIESFSATLSEALFTSGEELKLEFLGIIINEKKAFDVGVISFAAFLLNSLLTHEPTSVSLQSALSKHHRQWTSEFIPDKFKSIYRQLEPLLSKDCVMREIELVMDDGKVNLKHMLYIISLMSAQSPQHLDVVKASTDRWFKQALTDRNEFHLGMALLGTRHHFAELSKYFINYANWFGSVQAKSVLTLNFFFEFLSKLVPYEPAVFLKVQVTKVPSGPSSCQSIISDYISLAKTRLSDMNQTFDFISLFNDFHETLEEQQESDVRRVLAHFSDSGEVTKAVLEASVFRKQYYEKIFIPCLLSCPRGSDQTRDQLIIKLNTLGKIPSSVYRVWSKSR